MNTAEHSNPQQSTGRESDYRGLARVRSQAAFVRSLLDEVERAVPSSAGSALSAQFVEELARLGCRFLEVASTLTATVDDQEARLGASQTISQCA